MLKELVDGKFSLAESFYKFGLLGLLALRFVIKGFDLWLVKALGGVSIATYYTTYFKPIEMDLNAIFATLFYFASIFAFAFYANIILKAVWRSSAKFEKSPFVVFMAKVFTIAWIGVLAWSVI